MKVEIYYDMSDNRDDYLDFGLCEECYTDVGSTKVDKNNLFLNVEYDGKYFYFPKKFIFDRIKDNEFILEDIFSEYFDFILNKN